MTFDTLVARSSGTSLDWGVEEVNFNDDDMVNRVYKVSTITKSKRSESVKVTTSRGISSKHVLAVGLVLLIGVSIPVMFFDFVLASILGGGALLALKFLAK